MSTDLLQEPDIFGTHTAPGSRQYFTFQVGNLHQKTTLILLEIQKFCPDIVRKSLWGEQDLEASLAGADRDRFIF